MVFTTLKTPKMLIVSEIRAACPGGSKPPHSLGVRPSSRKKGRGVISVCSVIVRAKGLEPIRTKAPDPKSGLATNYNTLAKPFGRLITLSPSLKSAFWKLPTSVSERITKLCIFFKNPKQPASGHSQKQSSWIYPNRTGSCEAERPPCRELCGPPRN